MKDTSLSTPWQLLLVYNGYRLLYLLFFFGYFFFNRFAGNLFSWPYLMVLIGYGLISLFFLCLCINQSVNFNKQVLFSGIIDIIFIIILLSLMGDKQSMFVIFLNITVAALSILVPGRLAIFFAATASSLLLGLSFFEYAANGVNTDMIHASGIQGVSIFATAITAWYLAHRLRVSENIAFLRTTQLAGMQQINEYIVERLHSGVIYVDLNRRIKLMNTAAKNFFTVKTEYKDHTLAKFSKALDEKCMQFIQMQPLHKAVQSIIEQPYLRVHFFSAAVDSNSAVLIYLDDMMAVAQQAQQLKLASLGRFSASIAHELRNPLGAISHAIQLMGENNALNQGDRRLKELITNNCNRMNEVIKNSLQLSRREQSKSEQIDFVSFIIQFKNDFLIYNTCDICLDISANTTIQLVFDKSQLEQLLIILCDNAIKHGSNDTGEVSITISVKQDDLRTEIHVVDKGPGVPASLLDSIFEPFFSTTHVGFGMGLFIAKDLCEINQARLSVLPSDKGGCFVVTLNQCYEMLL